MYKAAGEGVQMQEDSVPGTWNSMFQTAGTEDSRYREPSVSGAWNNVFMLIYVVMEPGVSIFV